MYVDRVDFYKQCWTSDEYRRDRDGYMTVAQNRRPVGAHRLSFFLHYGFWPKVCRHTCDNPPCYNPTHLIDGTVADNNRDRARRNRSHRPWGNTWCVLNPGMPRWVDDPAGYQREQRRRQKAGTWVYRGGTMQSGQ